jgi:uncharacterized protein YcbK (DUF882 family)
LFEQANLLKVAGRGARSSPALSRLCFSAAALALFALLSLAPREAAADDRALKLLNTHTKETATIVFKRNGAYDPRGLSDLNQLLRDWRKNQPTKMDPELFDLIWEVYRQSGSNDYIHIVCGYRSPETNGMLRRRSKGVAKNSQHVRGKAMDFFIPGVPLAKLRAIGLRMQAGGVGYYPTSGSPFVHMDTGSVRHWPKMTRQQLVQVFPNGKTLHVPSDGKPLPGYDQALAAYKARKGKAADTAVAALDFRTGSTRTASRRSSVEAAGEPIVLAAGSADESEDEATAAAAPRSGSALSQARPVTLAANDASEGDVPLPRRSPRARPDIEPEIEFVDEDSFVAPDPLPSTISTDGNVVLASIAPLETRGVGPGNHSPFDFDSPSHWSAATVPAALTRAMAARDVSRGASMPIPPTAVVATIDVSRPLRAEAMTTAVLRTGKDPLREVTPVLAYAAPVEPFLRKESAQVSEDGVPLPVSNPLRLGVAAETEMPRVLEGAIGPRAAQPRKAGELTLTALDTQGLRLWIGTPSTRQKVYALLTMPDFSQQPSLLDKPQMAFAAGFGNAAYQGLRTDRFSGHTIQAPMLVDLVTETAYALR